MRIERLVNSVFESNTFFIFNEKNNSCFLVDCGDADLIVRFLKQRKLSLQAVFITHTHYDHIYGLNKLCHVYPNLIIYVSACGAKGLYSDKLNLSKYHSESFLLQTANVNILQGGQSIQLFDDEVLNIYETPGHDWSSLCYKVKDSFFTGDSYLPQYSLVTNFPKSNKEQALKSLEWIKKLSLGCCIYPGHGDVVYA